MLRTFAKQLERSVNAIQLICVASSIQFQNYSSHQQTALKSSEPQND